METYNSSVEYEMAMRKREKAAKAQSEAEAIRAHDEALKREALIPPPPWFTREEVAAMDKELAAKRAAREKTRHTDALATQRKARLVCEQRAFLRFWNL